MPHSKLFLARKIFFLVYNLDVEIYCTNLIQNDYVCRSPRGVMTSQVPFKIFALFPCTFAKFNHVPPLFSFLLFRVPIVKLTVFSSFPQIHGRTSCVYYRNITCLSSIFAVFSQNHFKSHSFHHGIRHTSTTTSSD